MPETLNINQTIDLREELRRVESELIRSALKQTWGHQAQAAQLLGINASTLNMKLKRLGIIIEDIFIDEDERSTRSDRDLQWLTKLETGI
jgi:DNA-binding NtrC family response regulator